MARAPEMYRRGHAVASLEEAAEGPSIWQVGTGWVGVRKRSRRGVTPEVFFILNTKSCILMRSLAPKMGIVSVFYRNQKHP